MRYSRDDDDVLCCCEYLNEDGERSHLLGLLCDCAEVDDAFDRLIRGDKWHQQQMRKICAVMHDRCRFPWRGGARRIPLDIIIPIFLVPILLWIGALNFFCFIFINLTVLPAIFYLVYRTCLREFNPRTKFFYSWSASTTFYLFYTYEYQVVGFLNLQKIISPSENFFLVLFALLAFFALYLTKRRAGDHFVKDGSEKRIDSRYCKVCQSFIANKDHHCIWIDECVSRSNFGAFVAFLGLTALTTLHGGLLLLTSVCESSKPLPFASAILIPSRCTHYNQNFSGDPAITFVAGCHCLTVTLCVLVLFVVKSFQCVTKKKM